MTFSKNDRLTLPIGYFGCGWSVTSGGLLRIPGLKTYSCSLRRHDPDQVPRVSPSRGRLSALLGSPWLRMRLEIIKFGSVPESAGKDFSRVRLPGTTCHREPARNAEHREFSGIG